MNALPLRSEHESTPADSPTPRSAAGGRRHWRGLDDLGGAAPRHQPAPGAAVVGVPVSRREFLRLMSASLALAGLAGCGPDAYEKLAPYVRQPEQVVPGKPLYFATAMPLGGYGRGVLVESHLGRPTKLEGNPAHPASLGATDAITQASILALYDPDRSRVVTEGGRPSIWAACLAAMAAALGAERATGGAGLRLLTETVTSPALGAQLRALLARYPAAKWYQYQPVNRDNVYAGTRLAFGEPVSPVYHLDRAAVVLALDADFLLEEPGSVRYAREFADGRRVRLGQMAMNRLYAVESTPAITGATADHRLALRPGQIETFARAVARVAGVDVAAGDFSALSAAQRAWAAAVAADLAAHPRAGLVLAGPAQPPVIHALAHAINDRLRNAGAAVVYTAPPEEDAADQLASLRALVAEMAAGRVATLVILGGNPVYTAPADLDFAGALARVGLTVHLGLYPDETAARCRWHIPQAHYLESWGDVRAHDGTATIMQPAIAPLYGGKSAHDVLAALLGQPDATAYTLVRDYWRGQYGRPGGPPARGTFDEFWRTSLSDGVVAGTALPARTPALRPDFAAALPSPAPAGDGLELAFRPDPTIWDGRFANNGWLQELPKPLTKLTWDNAALISPTTAARLGLANEGVAELRSDGRAVRAPVWVLPGQPDDVVTVHLGYGRARAGRVGDGAGFNAYALRRSDAPWSATGLEVARTGGTYTLASTQHHFSMEGRDLIRSGTIEEFARHPTFAHDAEQTPARGPSLYPDRRYTGYAWGMSIDLTACIGCNACILACQAENNIPITGKDQVSRGREMHWIRVDRYYTGDVAAPETAFQPVPCMQCENAPCELVCPVGATQHSAEGLNDMVYNRCIGTRYCSNNCPYKVRRFNFYDYVDKADDSLKLQRNPEVTVRNRGVMEKCTYCVQRIAAARIAAEEVGERVYDGDLQTACQQVCPTRAIIFGDINDPAARVTHLKAEPLDYTLLGELNTRPRTTYLARLRNPNPALGTG